MTQRTSFLVLGTFCPPNRKASAYGRTIARAVTLRSRGARIRLVSEEHWVQALTVPAAAF